MNKNLHPTKTFHRVPTRSHCFEMNLKKKIFLNVSLSLGKVHTMVQQGIFRLPNIKDAGDPGNERGMEQNEFPCFSFLLLTLMEFTT